MVPSAHWIELRVLGEEVWSRSLEERARRGKPEQEKLGGRQGEGLHQQAALLGERNPA